MKKLFLIFSASMLVLTSCSDDKQNPPKDGEEQVPQPVENSGPNTEGQRAVEATVNDSTGTDSANDTPSDPH